MSIPQHQTIKSEDKATDVHALHFKGVGSLAHFFIELHHNQFKEIIMILNALQSRVHEINQDVLNKWEHFSIE